MKDISFTPFPTLDTLNLTLRQLNNADQFAISSLRSNVSVNKYLDRPGETSIEEAISFISKINTAITENQSVYWAICFREKTELIGTICLWNFSADKKTAEIGFELLPDFQGQGLMDEALKCVLDFAFLKLGLNTLEAFVHRRNLNSVKLLTRNHFHRAAGRIDENNINIEVFFLNAGMKA